MTSHTAVKILINLLGYKQKIFNVGVRKLFTGVNKISTQIRNRDRRNINHGKGNFETRSIILLYKVCSRRISKKSRFESLRS